MLTHHMMKKIRRNKCGASFRKIQRTGENLEKRSHIDHAKGIRKFRHNLLSENPGDMSLVVRASCIVYKKRGARVKKS